jgi:hypothetical protein
MSRNDHRNADQDINCQLPIDRLRAVDLSNDQMHIQHNQ